MIIFINLIHKKINKVKYLYLKIYYKKIKKLLE